MVDLVEQYNPEAESNNFDDLPAGKYEAQIVESRREPVSKDKDLGDCLVLGWQITSGQFEKRMLWQRLNLWWTGPEKEAGQVVTIANTQFADVRKAVGVASPRDTDELHYIPCRVTYGPQKKNPQYSEVKYVGALGQPDRQVATAPTQQRAAAATQSAQPGKRAPWPSRAA